VSEQFRWVDIKSLDELERFYNLALIKIREAAKNCGYAIGVHGSLRRDLDLIAVPWVENHKDRDVLAAEIHKAACGLKMAKYQWEEKPNGRVATMFPICWIDFEAFGEVKDGMGHIDLSVR